MRAIIIGAGRGQRLMPTTENAPKCYAEIGGRRILDWIVEAFAENGIDDIVFIGGYLIEQIQADYPQFTFRLNEDWPNNNILESLMRAEDLMDEAFISTYADILFRPSAIAADKFVRVRLDYDQHPAEVDRFNVMMLPSFAVIDPGGNAIHAVQGYLPPDRFIRFLERARTKWKATKRTASPSG